MKRHSAISFSIWAVAWSLAPAPDVRAQAAAEITPSDPIPVNSFAVTDTAFDSFPRIRANDLNTWLCVWESNLPIGPSSDTDIYFSRSIDNGFSWSLGTPLNANAGADTGNDGAPQIVADVDGIWLAVWSSNEPLGGSDIDHEIFVARSVDNGLSWSPPALLNDTALVDIHADEAPYAATDFAGNMVAVWSSFHDLNGAANDSDIFCATSRNRGVSWSPTQVLNSTAFNDLGVTDTLPRIATDGAGAWITVWQSVSFSEGDILFARSADNGATWSPATPLNTNADTDAGFDSRPRVSFGNGVWLAVWDSTEDLAGTGTDLDVFISRSLDGGITWSDPAPLNANAALDSRPDSAAEIAADGAGLWTAVWESSEDLNGAGTDSDIFISTSTDNGVTWQFPQLLNSTAVTDTLPDQIPDLATNLQGNWAVVWATNQDIAGTGSDRDIFVSRFIVKGAAAGGGALTGLVLNGTEPIRCGAVRARNTTTNVERTVFLDTNGRYLFGGEAGRYAVTAFAGGFVSRTLIAAIVDGETAAAHFALDADPSLTGVRGFVVDENTRNPVAGALVSVFAGDTLIGEGFTCADGSYETRVTLPKDGEPVDVTVTYTADGYEFESQNAQVVEGEITNLPEAQLAKGVFAGSLAGIVRDLDTANPIENATVLIQGAISISTATSVAGEYSFTAIPEGDYSVTASAADYLPGNQQATVTPLGISEASFDLPPVSPAPILSVSPTTAFLPADAGAQDVVIANLGGGSLNWSASVTEGGDWLSVSKATEGENHGSVLANFTDNLEGANRLGRLTINSTEAGGAEVVLTQVRAEDINFDGGVNAVDVQLTINGALDLETGFDTDINNDGVTNSVDVQTVILAALE